MVDGQTILPNHYLVLTQSVWPSSAVPRQRTEDGLTTDRRIMFVLTQSADGLTTEDRLKPPTPTADKVVIVITTHQTMAKTPAKQRKVAITFEEDDDDDDSIHG